MNQEEPEEQNGQKVRFKSQNEKKKILNQNKQSPEDKSQQYYNKNKQLGDSKSHLYYNQNNKQLSGYKSSQYNKENNQSNSDKSHQYYNQNNKLIGNKCHQYYFENKHSDIDNFNKKNNQNIVQNKPRSGYKYYLSKNQNKGLENFTSKDIQEEYKEITSIFHKEALKYIDDKEIIKNENIGKFLIKVANVSRKAYNNSNELFVIMFKEFSKIKDGEKDISSLKIDEHLRKEFSSWVKEYEKTPEGKKKYENYFNLFKGKGRYAEEDYISILLSQLTIP